MPALIALIIGGLDAGGLASGIYGQEQTTDAINNTIGNNQRALQNYEKQDMGIFNPAWMNSTPQKANQYIQEGQNQFTGAANTANQLQGGFATPLTPVSKAINSIRAGQNAKAMGNLSGFSNLGQQWGLQNTMNQANLGLINNQVARMQALYPDLMQIAGRTGQSATSLSHLLYGLGSLAGGIGGIGGGAAGGGAAASPAIDAATTYNDAGIAAANNGAGPLWMQGTNALSSF